MILDSWAKNEVKTIFVWLTSSFEIVQFYIRVFGEELTPKNNLGFLRAVDNASD